MVLMPEAPKLNGSVPVANPMRSRHVVFSEAGVAVAATPRDARDGAPAGCEFAETGVEGTGDGIGGS